MYEKQTKGINIAVEPDYLDDQSEPDEDHYVWSYTVRIANNSEHTVQLRNRHWRLIDSCGRTEEIKGDGVVGEQPILKPGEAFEYTSGAPLTTPSGVMFGSYGMVTDQGEQFDAEIPAFSLDSPYQIIQLQ
ncbi:MAG: Co2+/Mg2+ efflux protein ApaG [bacterium]